MVYPAFFWVANAGNSIFLLFFVVAHSKTRYAGLLFLSGTFSWQA